jgi:limonene-1,2-epoxide hydrolase
MSGVEVEITGLAAENGIVWAERLDHVRFADGSRRTLPCLGRLEITDGAIARFTDYFDVRWFGRPQ